MGWDGLDGYWIKNNQTILFCNVLLQHSPAICSKQRGITNRIRVWNSVNFTNYFFHRGFLHDWISYFSFWSVGHNGFLLPQQSHRMINIKITSIHFFINLESKNHPSIFRSLIHCVKWWEWWLMSECVPTRIELQSTCFLSLFVILQLTFQQGFMRVQCSLSFKLQFNTITQENWWTNSVVLD